MAKEIVDLCTAVKDAPRSDRVGQGTVRTHSFKELCEKAEDRYEDRSIDESLLLGLQALALAACLYRGPHRKMSRDRAIRVANAALEHYRHMGAEPGEALALCALARLQLLRDRPDMAIRLATEAVGKFQKMGDQKAEASALAIVVDAHMLKAALVVSGKTLRDSRYVKLTASERDAEIQRLRAKHCEDALLEVQRAQELFAMTKDKRGKADLMCTLVEVYLGMESLDDAKEAAMNARDAFHDLGDRRGEQTALLLELDAHIAERDGREAVDVGREIVKLFRKAKDRKGEIEGMLTLLKVHQMTGQTGEVVKLVSEIRSACREEREAKMEGQAVDALMQTHIQGGRIDEAISTAQEAMDLYRRANDKSGEAMALHACACLRLDRFFEQLEKDLQEFRSRGCLQQYYKQPDMASYEECRSMVEKAAQLFKAAGDKQGQAMAEETHRTTEQRAAMMNDPDVTKQVMKDGRIVDVIRTWNPKKQAQGGDENLALGDYAG